MQKQSFLTQNDFWHKDYIVPAMFGIVECTLLALFGVPRMFEDFLGHFIILLIAACSGLFLLMSTLKSFRTTVPYPRKIDDEIKNENRRLAKFTVAIVFIVSILFIISIVISPSSDPKTIRWAWYIFAMALLIGETWIYIFFKKSALRTKESAPC